MEEVIVRGGSVLYQGRVLTRMEELPSAAELAAGDADKETAVAGDLQTQIAKLQAQLDKLQAAPKESKAAKAEPSSEKK